jgi:orotate phosphoribosyltransferase
LTNRLCQYIAGRFRDIRIDVVAGPAIGGVILAYEIARILGVRSIYAERKEAVLELRRGFQINNGERVLLVEDVITTGGSVLELASLCEGVGGKVIAVASLVDRTGGKHNMPYPFEALVQIDLPAYEREQCPLCRENVPLVKPGSQKLAHR